MKIGVVNNCLKGETRVAMTPQTAQKYVHDGFEVYMEKGAGNQACFEDGEYVANGARCTDRAGVLESDIILSVLPPKKEDLGAFKAGQWLVCDMSSFEDKAQMQDLVRTDIGVIDLSKMPRISRAQVMDVLSSQALVSGYRAAMFALSVLKKTAPLLMTSAGTLTPARAVVIGAGVAGLQAISVLKRMGANVVATDIREESKTEIESVGGKFAQDISRELEGADILITSAFSANKKPPLLVQKEALNKLAKNAVVLDMAEGNVEKNDMRSDLQFFANRHFERELAYSASTLFANNVYAFLKGFDYFADSTDFEDEILRAVLICSDGFLRGKMK
ncbi:MAG: hypothetical protein IJ870_04055 [Alphaproteobacteria bacterium]|nr:hypothetical protein [Alphaproteobacteria bacterium]